MTAATVRRTQEARSSDTRQKLASAAFELIQEGGYASFRVAAVARAVDVSLGGQLHHFPTKDAMTIAAIEYGIDIAQRQNDAHVSAYSDGDDAVNAIIADCRDYYFSASFDVAMDVTRSASGNETLRQEIARVHRAFRDRAEGGWQALLEQQGWPAAEAADVIAMSASLVRGFAIRAMIRPDRPGVDRLMKRWRQMVSLAFEHAAPAPE